MPSFVIAAASSAALGAPGDAALTIHDVVARHHELDGKDIRVRGWLTLCEPLSCWLTPGPRRDDRPYLSIGGSDSFDHEIEGMIGREIVIDARLDAKCLHIQVDDPSAEEEMFLCFDRASVLANPKLVEAVED